MLFCSESFSATKKTWGPVLATLNQEPVFSSTEASPFTQSIDTDLLALYDKEAKAIAEAWQVSEKITGTKASIREKQNQFFHIKFSKLNEAALTSLSRASEASRSHDHRAIAEKIAGIVKASEVARVENVIRYDNTGQVGFCFGRAMFIHHLLLKAGIAPQDLARIFLVGQLLVQEQMWQFHTAILVRDAKEGYLVLDPLQEKVMGYREWMKLTAGYEIKGRYSRARFYITDARKFLPAFGKYDVAQLRLPFLREYFAALAREMN